MATSTPATTEAADARAGSIWRNYDFLKFWVGETISLLGSQVTHLALPLTAIYAFNASDNVVGVLRFVELAPYIGLALLFGVWVDRHRRREVMLWTNAIRAVLIALIPVLHWYGVLTMPLLLAIACAVGIASVLFDVAWMPYVPAVVRDPRHFVDANAKVGVSYSVTSVAGPGLAGFLVAALTAPVALIVDAFSYVVSIVSLLLIRTPEPRPAPTAERHVMRELRDGVRYVFSRPILRWLAIVGFWCNFSVTSVWTMFLLYGTHELRLSSSTLGLIFGISSVGAVIGSMVSTGVIKRFPVGPVYFLSQTGLLLGPVVIVVAAGPRLVIVGLMILSFFTTYLGLGIVNVILVTLRQSATPQSLMSRMTACFRTLLFGGGALGGLAAGLIAGWVGNKNALIVAAAVSAAVLILLIISPVSRLREIPPPVTDPAASS